MRTSKPISTISYNTPKFLKARLDELTRNHTISDWIFIVHHAEADEKKDHIHLWLQPNKLLDTMSLQDFFQELDPSKPLGKPLGCIDFRSSKTDDWILYEMHLEAYLLSKGQTRQFHYSKADFVFADEDSFEDKYNHALKGSEWAQRDQITQLLRSGDASPVELINSGIVPLSMAGNLNAYQHMVERNGRPTHTPIEVDEDGVIVEVPQNTGFQHIPDEEIDF